VPGTIAWYVAARMPLTSKALAVFAYAILSRMAYVLYVGGVLRREERDAVYTRRFGRAEAFRRFRRTASLIMGNDAFAFILLCIVTRSTWELSIAPSVSVTTGAALALIGLGMKLWAARTLGSDAYYWHNFFDPEGAIGPVSTGPYRFISSPMYTVGYLQTYGLALMLRSLPGLVAAVFGQAAILTFYFLVEKPHFQRLHRSS
jgi:protein-S-isoprenylcysteine O-methyltransferase Ste14